MNILKDMPLGRIIRYVAYFIGGALLLCKSLHAFPDWHLDLHLRSWEEIQEEDRAKVEKSLKEAEEAARQIIEHENEYRDWCDKNGLGDQSTIKEND